MRARTLLIAGALVAVAVGGVAWRWKPLRYGRMMPPVPALDGLEPPLVRRIKTVVAAVEAAPYSAEAWGTLGGVYDVHDLYAPAIASYERAQTLDPGEFRWPYFLGRCTLLDDHVQSLAHYERAAALRPDYAPVHAFVGRGYFLGERLDEAEMAFYEAMRLAPDLPRARMSLAQIALVRGDGQGAIELLGAPTADTQPAEFYYLLAEAHRRLGDTAAAGKFTRRGDDAGEFLEGLDDPVWNELTAREGMTLRWRRVRSNRLVAQGRLDEAISLWEAAVDDYLQVAEVPVEIGLLHLRNGALAEAVTWLERGLEIDPEQHEVRNNLGTVLVRLGRVPEGLRALRDSCRAMPDSGDAHFNFAMGLRAAGRDNQAVTVFERLLTIDPEHTRGRFEYGLSLVALARFGPAADAFHLVIDADPENAAAWTNLVRAIHRQGRYAEAMLTMREATARLPGDPRLRVALAWQLATTPDSDSRDGAEARSIIEPLCRQAGFNDAGLLDTLAAACAETGDYDAAVQHATRALELLQAAPATVAPEQRRRRIAAIRARAEQYRRKTPFREGG